MCAGDGRHQIAAVANGIVNRLVHTRTFRWRGNATYAASHGMRSAIDHVTRHIGRGSCVSNFLRRSSVRYLENHDAYECLASARAPLSKLI
jgi:hypothetical protein